MHTTKRVIDPTTKPYLTPFRRPGRLTWACHTGRGVLLSTPKLLRPQWSPRVVLKLHATSTNGWYTGTRGDFIAVLWRGWVMVIKKLRTHHQNEQTNSRVVDAAFFHGSKTTFYNSRAGRKTSCTALQKCNDLNKTLSYGYEDGVSLASHSGTTSNSTSSISCAVPFWAKLKAWLQRCCIQSHSVCLQ